MKDTFFYLSTCDTCNRILKELDLTGKIVLQDIKSEPLSTVQLEQLKDLAGSYEALFSKRARLYKERNLKDVKLGENDYRALLLEHYTFLKRPVLAVSGELFIGNAQKTVAEAREFLHP
jgi:arsenate reductase